MADESVNKIIPQILIVDDVEANRFILRNIITEMGYQPILAENGVQALKVVQRMKPQLTILDIAMPEMSGYEVCAKMREDPETRDIPIIFISAFDDPKDIVRGFEFGGNEYITKPFIPEEVKIRVELQLQLYRTSRELQEKNRQLQEFVKEQVRQIENERRNVLYALLRIARENSFYNKEFMDRLSYNCRILSEAMQLSETYSSVISDAYIDMIELSASLCDLGNIAVPVDILQKKSSLTKEENRMMQRHTRIGAEILGDVAAVGSNNDFIKMSAEIAKYHHENWDGSGYPEGLAGDEIPLAAQIVGIVGAYCALTENRTYRGAFGGDEAIDIMERDTPSKFNPEIFWILKKISKQLR